VKRQRIFISYRRSDTAGHAGRLKADLERRLGHRVFMDESGIPPGDQFAQVIDQELRSCGALLAVIGRDWRDTFRTARDKDYVLLEVGHALRDDGVSVIPVLVEGAPLPAVADLPAEVQGVTSRQAVALRDDRWDDDVAQLASSLRTELGLSRLPRWLVPAALAAIAIVGVATWMLWPPVPGPFDRAQAHETALDAARNAVSACGVGPGVEGECPVLMEFVPNGRVRKVYFDTGSCRYKGSGFGDCVLGRLERVRIHPFNDVETAQIEIGIRLDPKGAVDVFVDE
jgi:hypothetical protein